MYLKASGIHGRQYAAYAEGGTTSGHGDLPSAADFDKKSERFSNILHL
jgi:hypothetical protein